MDLEARVRRLELQNSRLKLVLGFLTIAGMVFAAAVVLRVPELHRESQQADATTFVQAERFILQDAEGNQRAVLGIGTNDEALFELNDASGTARLRMDVPRSGPGITLKDSRGKVRTLLTVYTDGPYLGMTDAQGSDLFQAP